MKDAFTSEILTELFKPIELAVMPVEGEDPPVAQSAFGGRVIAVHYSGLLSQARLNHFKPLIFSILTGNAQQVIIDLAAVSGVSQSTLGVLVSFASAVQGRGKRVYLLSPPQEMLKILEGLRLGCFFETLRDENDLIGILPDE